MAKTKSKETKSPVETSFDDLMASVDLMAQVDLLAKGPGSGSGGSGGGGIGGGGGSPGGGTPGGGGGGSPGGGGKPGGESVGNNLSFPAIFVGEAPTLRGTMGDFLFTTPTTLSDNPDYVYFAQGVEGNTWQADNLTTGSVVVDYVDIGDALASAPLKTGTNVRLELTLHQDLLNPDLGEPAAATMTAFEMTLLGGAKGSGKPSVVGPTESQGARLPADLWVNGGPYDSTIDGLPADNTTTYESAFASIYGADASSAEGETVDSYMGLSIQKVTGVTEGGSVLDLLAQLSWDGTNMEWADGDGAVTVGDDLVNTAFGPELNIAGKYIMGASGKPFKFTSDGTYLITFSLEDGAPISFDGNTMVANDIDLTTLGFQPGEAAGRVTEVIADASDHNGLLVMLVGIPSSVESGGEGE